jgi:hypothetical protein
MYRLRPAADHLTAFYLSMSVGGVIGGAFCAIVAPTLFDWTYEHPLLVLAAALLLPQRAYLRGIERLWERRRVRTVLTLLLPTLVLLLSLPADQRFWPGAPDWAATAAPVLIGVAALFSIGRPAMFAMCLLALMMSYGGWSTLKLTLGDTRTRSYFGVYTVSTRPSGSARVLTHGTTVHGVQSLRPGLSQEPTSYYTRMSGVGLAMAAAEPLYGPRARIGVVGLGTGTLACYRVPGQSWTFFEIDPAMVRIARDPKRFTFLSGCAPDARVVLGDARLTLARQPPAGSTSWRSTPSVPMPVRCTS